MSRSFRFRVLAALMAMAVVAGACGGDDSAAEDTTGDSSTSSGDESLATTTSAEPTLEPLDGTCTQPPVDTTEDTASDTVTSTETTSATSTETATSPDSATSNETSSEDSSSETATSSEDSSSETATSSDTATSTAAGPPDGADLTVKPAVDVPATAPTELVVDDIVTGTGTEAAAGDFLIMEYVGVACSTGLQFDASWDRGQPFSFLLGEGAVIDGWDQGIVGMAVGGRRELTIPPDLAYGDEGSGSGSIRAGETLVFVVDLLGVIPAGAELAEATVPAAPATELATTDLVEGDGAEAVDGSVVWLHYRGLVQSTGEQFDATLDRGVDQPLAGPLVEGQLIDGLVQGIVGMKVGGVREIVIPADLAFGDAGAGDGAIGPGETIVFVVGLYAVT